MKLKTIAESLSPKTNSWLKGKIENADKYIADYSHRKEVYELMEKELEKISNIDPDATIELREPIWPQLNVQITGASSSAYDKYKKYGKAWQFFKDRDLFVIYYEIPSSWGLTRDGQIDHKLDK